MTLTPRDVQVVIGCGKNNPYALIENAMATNLFVVKKIGKKHFIPSEQFRAWYSSCEDTEDKNYPGIRKNRRWIRCMGKLGKKKCCGMEFLSNLPTN